SRVRSPSFSALVLARRLRLGAVAPAASVRLSLRAPAATTAVSLRRRRAAATAGRAARFAQRAAASASGGRRWGRGLCNRAVAPARAAARRHRRGGGGILMARLVDRRRRGAPAHPLDRSLQLGVRAGRAWRQGLDGNRAARRAADARTVFLSVERRAGALWRRHRGGQLRQRAFHGAGAERLAADGAARRRDRAAAGPALHGRRRRSL